MSDENELQYRKPLAGDRDKGWDDLTVLTWCAGITLANSGIEVLIAEWSTPHAVHQNDKIFAYKIVGLEMYPTPTAAYGEVIELLLGIDCGAHIERKKHTKELS